MFNHLLSIFVTVLLLFSATSMTASVAREGHEVSGRQTSDRGPVVPSRATKASQPNATEKLRKYELQRLRELDVISAFMAGELQKLREASETLAAKVATEGGKESSKVSVDVGIPSLRGLGSDGKVILIKRFSCQDCNQSSRSDLGEVMKLYEGLMEELRNEKEMITNQYSSDDNDDD